MKQLLQNLKIGTTEVCEVPAPRVAPGQVLIRSMRSLISAGTERMLVEFGKANLIDKARQQPDKVRQVLDKVRTDGLTPTISAVRNKLDQPLALGYCNAGIVLEVGPGVTEFAPGDRVASNGRHAEIVAVPTNLCAGIPDSVTDDAASFTVLSAIALQGIRLVAPTLGETVAVSGLGLIGLITVQLLRAHGCKVLGLDFDADRLAMARRFGAETVDLSKSGDPVEAAQAMTNGHGADAVIITASTKSSEPVHQAALMCRQRGRIVLVGVTGLELSRADFYEKELTFQVSCSYGPGRYDPRYEDKGLDYPIGFVRWTEQRNFEAILSMLAVGRLDVDPLISHRFELEDVQKAYAIVGGAEPSLGIVMMYPPREEVADAKLLARSVDIAATRVAGSEAARVSFIGSGNYATGVLIPAFQSAGAYLSSVVSSTGVSGVHAARKFGFESTSTDATAAIGDATTNAVVITTRHDSHAGFALSALERGKHVFVEKPLCLTEEELDRITQAYRNQEQSASQALLMVGFNRRFAPHIVRMKDVLANHRGPKSMIMTVNAGHIPKDHWTQDPEIGGGRIIGEACHFIDLLRFLAASPIAKHAIQHMESESGDTATITLGFEDGSTGTVHYFANGNKAFPKERLEVFSAGGVLQLDNFRVLRGYGLAGFRTMRLGGQDKGQKACVQRFVDTIRDGGPPPIPFDEIAEVARVSIALTNNEATR